MAERLLPLAKAGTKEFLVDIKKREFRDFDRPDNVVKMHSPAGRALLAEMEPWNSMGISTGRAQT